MSDQKFPPGWDDKRVQALLKQYEEMTEDEQVAEDEAAQQGGAQTVISVPTDLLPAIRQLLASHKSA
jgi:hypothetical protein